jgi:hypothetical protein
MTRPKIYNSHAERQKAYRERRKEKFLKGELTATLMTFWEYRHTHNRNASFKEYLDYCHQNRQTKTVNPWDNPNFIRNLRKSD